MTCLLRRSIGLIQRPFRLSAVTWQHVQRCQSKADPKTDPSNETEPLRLSDSCVKQLKKLGMDKNLRVFVEGGGCSGFQYKFDLDPSFNPEDRVIEKDGVKIVVDKESLEYLKGSTIDYSEELIRSAFRVVNNPVAEQGCSCGSSFNVKL
ncbi:iron-sulfur cluster assembly 2 homolog, mitochondrial-like [Gigantopelta aegis]|uniref:iron-sulfur cluster assembly 2 homolog, mitochondrial-like n=1 Tax=Gigantopelta aegis TaxID=1735272 RepID=UPI001B88CA56|nr:iron-sulfur cluster assembly 2 homolog, mitochondrial-like [Gigantopelta aegis]